jgi:N-methylhydantoinase A
VTGRSLAGRLRIAVDTGGTFTDLLVTARDGGFRLYKRPSTPDDPTRGVLDTIAAAAEDLRCTPREFLAQAELFVLGTTRATNAIVDGSVAKTALLCTRGHPDVLLLRQGGRQTSIFDNSQEYPDPYVPRSLTFEVSERILSDGAVLQPLDEPALVHTLRELGRLEVEAVAVCFLWSIVNPSHEVRVGELLDQHLPGVPHTLSHRLNPSIREYPRAVSAAIDASLKPLMSDFFARLEERLRNEGFAGRLLVMTSSGGVLDASAVSRTPVHSIGSGPAAAPVAGLHYARVETESETAIVTDAGGTTFDVSLIRAGQIPETRETRVGSVIAGTITGFRSIDVKSIGAGGGSIAWVDEEGLLHVGPHSAGSVPGPACYGRGGRHATVTDACLVLGYLDPDFFLGGEMKIRPELSHGAVKREIARPLGLETLDAAATVFDLAVGQMVEAIEEITLKQGIDPTTAAMIAGGGGAGLYAVRLARRLGCQTVVVPEVSAALSAAGMLLSDLQADYAITDLLSTSSFDRERANQIIGKLKAHCAEFIAGAKAGSVDWEIRLAVEARYPHQVWEIEVPLRVDVFSGPEDVAGLCTDFHRIHEQIFTVNDPASAVEVVAWRARVRCNLGARVLRTAAHSGTARAVRTRQAYFPGFGSVEAVVLDLDALVHGETVKGPALVESPVTTVVIDPGASVTRTSNGSLRILPAGEKRPAHSRDSDAVGAELALITSRFDGIVQAMINTLLRTARSTILNTARDFSCCILTADDEMLAMSDSLPIHVISGPDLMARVMKTLHSDIRAGDAFLNNSPYDGNSHAADWSILVPVLAESGEHRYTVLAKAHLADCGNAIPTTYSPDARDVYEEGALIFPCVRVQQDYRDCEDILRIAKARIRIPQLWYGDYLALLGAARIGERRLLELLEELGADRLATYQREWFDYSERRMINAIKRVPGGIVTRQGRHDPIPAAPEGVPVRITLSIDPEEAIAEVDLRHNLDCLPSGLNLTEATARTCGALGIFAGLGSDVPPNAGSFRRIRVHVRENCAVGIPRHPASCSAATGNLAEIVANLVAGAMAELGEGFGMAEYGKVQAPALGVISGNDPRSNGEPFVSQLLLATNGGAAGPHADGWLTSLGIGAAGFLLRDSIEIDELKYPICIRTQRLHPDSEGAGRFRGAPGAYVEYGPIGCAIDVIYISDGHQTPSRGVRGGQASSIAKHRKQTSKSNHPVELGGLPHVRLEPGETVISISSGGGGYGPPTDRDPARVQEDVHEGWISAERARTVYHVALNTNGDLDPAETQRLRGAHPPPSTATTVH